MHGTEGKERESAEHDRTKAAIEAGDTLLREDANDECADRAITTSVGLDASL